MTEPTIETYLHASKSMLYQVCQRQTDLSAEEQANLQEAIEFIDRTHALQEDADA